MGKFEELRDDVVNAYEEATGQLPDTRDYVKIEELVREEVKGDE